MAILYADGALLYYELLVDFLKEQGQCAFDFINADKYPFEEELIVKDKFYDCLRI